jgi:hypothetical protein
VLDRVGDSSINGGFIWPIAGPSNRTIRHCEGLLAVTRASSTQSARAVLAGSSRAGVASNGMKSIPTVEHARWLIAHLPLPLMLLQRYPYRLGIKATQASQGISTATAECCDVHHINFELANMWRRCH